MLRLQALLLLLPCASAFAPTVLPLVNSDRHSVALRRPDGVRGLALQLKTQTDPLKNERGNNIGDPRYTTTYTEDLKEYVEDLPAGTTEEQIRDIAARLRASAIPADIVSGRIKYRNHFSGTDVVDWMLKERIARDRRVAVALGREMVRKAEIVHCTRGHDFKDEELFYRFVSDYEKRLMNPRAPVDYVMRVLVTPPILFGIIFTFLIVANVKYVFIDGGSF